MVDKRHPIPGFGASVEYQVSGLPYVTSSFGLDTTGRRIDFPFVTRDITVANNGASALRVGFTQNGVNGNGGDNFYVVRTASTVRLELRVKTIFVRSDTGTTDCSILAGLTTIPQYQMGLLTGSAVTGSYVWQGV